MPTFTRLILIIILFASLGYAVIWSLATFVQPYQSTMTIKIPASQLKPEIIKKKRPDNTLPSEEF